MEPKYIATLLPDGTYGQREMTAEELAEIPEPIPAERVDTSPE